tara:strand:- start:33 stop:1154 length:1122 start_codon:yes stop_codon:yes gene_type:complete
MVIYPLLNKYKKKLNNWIIKKDKVLFIHGKEGTGKSTLANHLLKDYHIVNISSEYVNNRIDVIETIKLSLFTKNILMMCNKNSKKVLLIDDFNYFIKYDKTTALKLINFVKEIQLNYHIIIISSNITHKLFNICYDEFYEIECICNKNIYNEISINRPIKTITSKQGYTNLHSINNGLINNISDKDKDYSINQALEKIIYENNNIYNLFIISSIDYRVIPLNILENSSKILRSKYKLYDIYKSICISDMLENKYLENNVDIDILLLYSCIIPSITIKNNRIYKKVKLNYNKYISHSLIQIHNQSLLSSFNYLELLNLLYLHKLSDNTKHILTMINNSEYNINILFKQIKVYNYFYNKNITKKYITQTLKNISS